MGVVVKVIPARQFAACPDPRSRPALAGANFERHSTAPARISLCIMPAGSRVLDV